MLMKLMMSPLIVIVVLAFIYWVVIYNSLISGRNQIRRAYSGIDVQLKKRWDLIPQLVNVVRGYAEHEARLLEKLVQVRSHNEMPTSSTALTDDRLNEEKNLSERCTQVMAVAESYPELKSSKQFIMLQRNLTEIEAQLAASRRSYNACVVKYNNSVESFPSNIIARQHQFGVMDYFSIDLTERNNVQL